MKIQAIYHGSFPQVFRLYSRFRPNVRQLKLVLDVEPAGGLPREQFIHLYNTLARNFPSLARHTCCDEWQGLPLFLQEEEGIAIKRVGECTDVAHLVEHIIVDCMVLLDDMASCSGITCGYKSPENRFDIFIECDNIRAGLFASHYAVYLVEKILSKKGFSRRNLLVLELAKYLLEHPEAPPDPLMLADEIGWREGEILFALNGLRRFQFFDRAA
jgi:hypothetical protein